jgi:hypothetical protein
VVQKIPEALIDQGFSKNGDLWISGKIERGQWVSAAISIGYTVHRETQKS